MTMVIITALYVFGNFYSYFSERVFLIYVKESIKKLLILFGEFYVDAIMVSCRASVVKTFCFLNVSLYFFC